MSGTNWTALCSSLLECMKCLHKVIQEILFAADCALLVHKDCDLQLMLNKFLDIAMFSILTISLNKIEVLNQPLPNTKPVEPNIIFNDTPADK